MDQKSSTHWPSIQKSLDERMEIITDFTYKKKESMVNPFDLPEDDERYEWLVFVARLRGQKPLEMLELAANNGLELSELPANDIFRNVNDARSRLKLI